jgi:hypothetical protein
VGVTTPLDLDALLALHARASRVAWADQLDQEDAAAAVNALPALVGRIRFLQTERERLTTALRVIMTDTKDTATAAMNCRDPECEECDGTGVLG